MSIPKYHVYSEDPRQTTICRARCQFYITDFLSCMFYIFATVRHLLSPVGQAESGYGCHNVLLQYIQRSKVGISGFEGIHGKDEGWF